MDSNTGRSYGGGGMAIMLNDGITQWQVVVVVVEVSGTLYQVEQVVIHSLEKSGANLGTGGTI